MLTPAHATAFEDVVDDYDAARPRYPSALFAELGLDGARVLELGAGTGIATGGLLAAGARLVATDLGPKMLRRLHSAHPTVPAVVARAEALPFAAASFDAVCGAQMWHWVDVASGTAAVLRVLRPSGRLAVWWNDVDADGEPWHEAQQRRLEAASPGYRRSYRARDYGAELAAAGFAVREWTGCWTRELDWPLYERWLRSKSYVQALPDLAGFLAAERASLAQAFPDGRIVEPFRTRLVVATLPA